MSHKAKPPEGGFYQIKLTKLFHNWFDAMNGYFHIKN